MKSIVLNIPEKLNIPAQAAHAAQLSKRTFIEIMGKYGVSVFSSTCVDDLMKDIVNA